jgi:NAD(P)H-flavin reductase
MRYFEARLQENRSLGGGYFVLRLAGCESLAASKPGQFVMIRGNWERDPLLPRAFSLMAVGRGGTADILAKTVGRGTAMLERTLPGASLNVLGPLGTAFPEPQADRVDLLVAGTVREVPYAEIAHAVVEVEFKQPPEDEVKLLEERESR